MHVEDSRPPLSGGAFTSRKLILVCVLAVVALAPLPSVRAVGLAALIALTLRSRFRIVLDRWAVGTIAFAFALLGLALPVLARHPGDSAAQLREMSVLAAATLVWIVAAGRETELALEVECAAWPILGALAAALVLDLGPVDAPFAWRGDEDLHVVRTRLLGDIVARSARLVGAGVAFGAVVGVAAARALGRRAASAALALAAIAGAAAAIVRGVGFLDESGRTILLRYNPFEAWLWAALATAPGALGNPALACLEGWWRLGPLLCVLVGVGAIARFAPGPPLARLACALAFATTPNVRYYTSLLYVEAPILLAMTWVLLELGRERSADGWPRGGAYLALLALPFMKTTTFPFLAVVGVASAAAAWRSLDRRAAAMTTLRSFVVTTIPVALVLGFKICISRPYEPEPSHLLVLENYRILAGALVQQFGPILLLAPVGLYAAWRRGRRDQALLLSAITLAYTGFFMIDGCIPPLAGRHVHEYCGYSRYWLYLIPPLVALGGEALALPWPEWARLAALLGCVASNLAASPVSISGARRPYWGDYVVSTSEFTYPYDRALALLSPGREGQPIVIVGVDYPYYGGVYRDRYGARWRILMMGPPKRPWNEMRHVNPAPTEDLDATRVSFAAALRTNASGIVVQLMPFDHSSEWPERAAEFTRVGDLALGDCRLIVYARP